MKGFEREKEDTFEREKKKNDKKRGEEKTYEREK